MMAKALKTFRGRYGLIRAGTTFNCEPGYFAQLLKNKLVEESDQKEPPAAPGPSKDRSVPTAPGKAGKENPGKAGTPGATVRPLAGGVPVTSSSLRADLASRAKPSKKSAAGAKVAKAKILKTRVVKNPPAA